MFDLIWKNIVRRKNQSILTIAITAITIFTFVLFFGVFITMRQGLSESADRLGADAIIIPSTANANGYELLYTSNPENEYMSIDVMKQVEKLDGVEKISPQFFSQTIDGSCCDFGMEMRLVGFDPNSDFVVKSLLNQKDYEELTDQDIILGGEFTDYVGKTARVLDTPFHVGGELYPTGTGLDKTIFLKIDRARQITKDAENLNVLPEGVDPSTLISAVMVKLDGSITPDKFAHDFIFSGIDAQCISTTDTVAALQTQLAGISKIIFGIWLALLAVAVLALVGRFNALAKDRKKEIGLMRAIGVQKKQVFMLIIGEACTMALAGGAAGSIAAGLCLSPVMNMIQTTFMLPPAVWNIGMTILSGVLGVVLSLVICFCAAINSAIKSASLEPQTAITQGEVN
ncbi:MAG: ABC transporter permease [Clostridiales bacterium]|nr:ABC transporter permease [Candidatus Crickella merdequi]